MTDTHHAISTTTPVSAPTATGVVSFPHDTMNDVRGRLDLNAFRIASSERCLHWHPRSGVMDWPPELWGNAVLGEIGEAANALKKLLDGQRDPRHETDHLIWELCDVFIYADILAARLSVFSRSMSMNPKFVPPIFATTDGLVGVVTVLEGGLFTEFPDHRAFFPRVFRRMATLVDRAITEDNVADAYLVMGMAVRCLQALTPIADAYIRHVFNTKSAQIGSPIRLELHL